MMICKGDWQQLDLVVENSMMMWINYISQQEISKDSKIVRKEMNCQKIYNIPQPGIQKSKTSILLDEYPLTIG